MNQNIVPFQELMFAGTTHGAMHVTDSGTLNIHGVRKEDGGFYICTALSVAGSSVTKAYLEVQLRLYKRKRYVFVFFCPSQ